MKGLPLLLSAMSGSLGGLTFSHNRGGGYVRERAIPTQPNSFQQTIVKAIFGSLSTRWSNVLTAAQRDDWDVYATNTPLTDKIGQSFTPTGLNMYLRGNTPLSQAGGSLLDEAPVNFGLPDVTPPEMTVADAGTQTVSIAFNNADAWAGQDQGKLLVYVSRPQGEATNFFKGPYRFAGTIDGNSITPPTSPASITVPFSITAGQKVFVRMAVVDEEARKSQDFTDDVIATAV